jgi:lipopolysaccharide/colanic/teichoic acid biosynthesis glycosyltransferase
VSGGEQVPYPLLKSAIDKVASAVLLLVVSPIAVVALAAMAVDMLVTPRDRGPVLYRERRISDGREFDLLKLRTLRVDVLAAGAAGHVRVFEADAANLTRSGRLLKRWYLDELPQLVNVLTGSMSLVGPRPPLASEVAAYEGHVGRRLLVKPGLTGLWQVSGRSDLSWEEAVRLDLHYVDNWSLGLDLQLLARTARVVVTAKGAY